jgi:uncharacterized protein YaaQ
MKLMIVILNDVDAESVLRKLIEAGYRATRISSTGGFLRRGNTTLLMGMEENKVDGALDIIRANAQPPEDAVQRRATIFVLNLSRYEQV